MLRRWGAWLGTFLLLLGLAPALFAEDSDKVLAQVGETKITQSYLDGIMDDIPAMYRARFQTAEGKKQLLEKIVDITLLSGEARRLNLEKDLKVVTKIKNMTDQLLSMEYLKTLSAQIKVSDDEMKSYYDAHKAEFQQQEEVKARHILVKTEAEAKAIQEELKKGKDFSELAKEKSTCPSKERGGDLGWFGRGRMDPEFEKVAFGLKKGEVSGIVKTQFGYHIIKVDDRKEPRPLTFEEAKPQIKAKLMQQKEKQKVEETLAKLKKDNKVQIFETSAPAAPAPAK